MRFVRHGWKAITLALIVLPGCGGGGGDGGSGSPQQGSLNQAPIANAGADQTVAAGAVVTLSGGGSSDTDGSVAAYAWSQTGGPTVALGGAATASPSFTAPAGTNTVLTFSLTVTDNAASQSIADSVSVTVQAGGGGMVTVTGKVTYARVPFRSTLGLGLDYASPRQESARGVVVSAIDVAGLSTLASGATDDDGNYALVVPASTNMFLRVRAEMTSPSGQSTPRWSFQVRDVSGNASAYTYDGPTFASGAGTSSDVPIPSGWSAIGQPNGPRAAAPFAILDTVWRAYHTILAVAPSTVFPTLTLDWATNNEGGATFYTRDANGSRIVISGEAGVDTDEYDGHVIAHEFGHYIEDRFARSDSIGGPHAVGDRLDMRVAFGEGWGYFFGCLVMGDPVARDSVVFAGQQRDGFFNIEQDSTTAEGWFSESSAQEILWDIYDSTNDGADTLSMGFAPIWDVLTQRQRTTDALTSIFSFAAGLKELNPGSATQVDQLLAAENIVGPGNDIYGSAETNGAGATAGNVLPVYTPIALNGGSQTVRSIDDYGTENKLSNHRYLRLNMLSTQRVRIRASAPGRDPDVDVMRLGVRSSIPLTTGDEDFNVTLTPGTWILDVYDCDNAGTQCAGSSPTPGDTSIVVTVTN